MRVFTTALASVLTACLAAGCGRTVDLSTSLQLHAISSGWLDAGIVDGKRKIVPTLSFTVKNRSGKTLPLLQVNALFGRVGDEDEWGSSYLAAAGREGLAPGATSALTATSQLGYTGFDSRAEMLANSQFVDARVDLFAKYGSTQWTHLGRYKVDRSLLAR